MIRENKRFNSGLLPYVFGLLFLLPACGSDAPDTMDAETSTVEAYAVPSIYSESEIFSIKVNGNKIPVLTFSNYYGLETHYAHMSVDGPVSVEVTYNGEITSSEIRPRSYKIAHETAGNVISHDLDKARYLTYLINDEKPLFLLASPIDKNRPVVGADGVIDMAAAYNLDTTGERDETDVIQKVLDKATATGGATLLFTDGVYKIKRLKVGSNITLYLDGGAVLKGTGVLTDYEEYDPERFTRIAPFVHIDYAQNTSIRGRGTIDPSGVELAGGVDDIRKARLKVRATMTSHSNNIHLEGIVLRNSTSWTGSAWFSDNFHVDNVKIMNTTSLKNGDGYNMVLTRNSSAINSFYYGGDDAMCAKAPEPTEAALKYLTENNLPLEVSNILYENNVIYTTTRTVTFGMQGDMDIHDVTFRNIEGVYTRDGIDFKKNYGSGNWSNILIEDVNLDEVTGVPYNMQIKVGGTIKGVEITRLNVDTRGSRKPSIKGLGQADSIDGITITDFTFLGKKILDPVDADFVIDEKTVKNVTFK